MRPSGWLRAGLSLAHGVMLNACVEASIGLECPDSGSCEADSNEAGSIDADVPCLGEGVSCEATEHEAPQFWDRLIGQGAPGEDFPSLEPDAVLPITGLTTGYRVLGLVGDGTTGLLVTAWNHEAGRVLLAELNEEAAVIQQSELPAPQFSAIPGQLREWATGEEVTATGCWPSRVHAGRVLLRCGWQLPCDLDDPHTDCVVGESVSFSANDLDMPERMFLDHPTGDGDADWALAEGGGVWEFKPGALRRYDRDGKLVVSQNVLAGRAPSYYPVEQAYMLNQPIMTGLTNGDLSLYTRLDSGKAELWRFDAGGSPLQIIDVPYVEPTTLRAGLDGSVLLFSMSTWGDIVQRAVLPNQVEPAVRFVRRRGFYDMYLNAVTRDAIGNHFVLTRSGSTGSATTLCMFPALISSSARCYEIEPFTESPGLFIGHGERKVFYLPDSELVNSSDRAASLLRFNLPR